MNQVCRWGFLSTAGIGKKNWRAIRRSGNGQVVAVASRKQSSAQQFIDECQQWEPFGPEPQAVEGYQELIDRPDIDAIYNPLPTALRKEWTLKAIAAGKHVLGEKPAGVHAGDVEEILAAAKAKGVQYMDGVMFMHSGRMLHLRQVLDEGSTIGAIRRVATQFSFCGDETFRTENIRSMSQSEPHGCLGDLGWYCLRMILWTLQWQPPRQVIAHTLATIQGKGSPSPVPASFSGELFYDQGLSASFFCSFLTHHQQWCHISGDRGFASIEDFVLPFHGTEVDFHVSQHHFMADGCDFHMERHTKRHAVPEYSSGRPTAQEVSLFQKFSQLVLDRNHDPSWGQMTLATQQLLDACWQSAQSNGAPVAIDSGRFAKV